MDILRRAVADPESRGVLDTHSMKEPKQLAASSHSLVTSLPKQRQAHITAVLHGLVEVVIRGKPAVVVRVRQGTPQPE